MAFHIYKSNARNLLENLFTADIFRLGNKLGKARQTTHNCEDVCGFIESLHADNINIDS